MNSTPIIIIFIPIITACLIYLIHKPWISALTFICQGALSLVLFQYSGYLQAVKSHELIIGPWSAWIGVGLKNDLLSLCFLWLTLLFWWVMLFYIWSYRKRDYKFLFFLFFLEGTFLGLLQSNDLFNLFVFIDITTILSTILIIYEKDGYAIKSGIYYLLFNSVGMLFYQLGFIILYSSLGTLNMSLLAERLTLVPHSNMLRAAYLFFLVAVGVKSAVFPVYNWLPRAHSAAPSAISALLSGLLVKSGLYAFLRIQSLFSFTFMNEFFFYLGLFSALSGVIFALSQKDLKQILAYHTVSQIGLIVMGLSHPNTVLYLGGITHLVNHALFKGLLFLCAGIIIHHYKKRRVTEIRGVFQSMPVVSVTMIIGMISITGGLLTNGYLSKGYLTYGVSHYPLWVKWLYQVVNFGTVASFVKVAQIFFGQAPNGKREIRAGQWAAVGLLAFACLLLPWIHEPFWKIFGLSMPHLALFSWNKAVLYSIQLLTGIGVVHWIANHEPHFIRFIRHFQLGFGTSNALMLFFLLLMVMSANLLV